MTRPLPFAWVRGGILRYRLALRLGILGWLVMLCCRLCTGVAQHGFSAEEMRRGEVGSRVSANAL